MQPALRIQNLRKSFRNNEVVKGISLQIEPGEIFGLLGPNGAGKSTTINMIGGVCHIGSGKIEIFGHDVVADYRTTRRLTGVMHQEVVIDVFFTIEQALSLYEGYYGAPSDPKWRNTLIDALALGPYLKLRTNQLSGGTKRRFMVAKALIHKPRFLILDEPTAGVDVELRQTLWQFVREVNRQGTTVLLTTHYLNEAESMCERIAIMNKGRVIALENKEKLLGLVDDKKLRITVDKDVNDIPAGLRSFAPQVLGGGRVLEFHLKGKTPRGTILDAVKSSGLTIMDVETETASLEDVFLRVTQEDALQ